MTTLFIFIFLFIIGLGFRLIYKDRSEQTKTLDFANEFRNKFVDLSNKYFAGHSSFPKRSELDEELYHWLTKNSIMMQSDLGRFGIIEYIGPFQTIRIKHYEVVINTLPKYRDGNIQAFDVNTCDDTLLRFIGVIENEIKTIDKELKNPFKWLQRGFKTVFSLPIYLLNWFGIINDATVSKISKNFIYNIVTGVLGLITFLSGIVTIIQGRDATVQFLRTLFDKGTSP